MEGLARGAEGDPAMIEPDWSKDYHEDFWDTTGGRIVGQCRVHVVERRLTFYPKGFAGALDMSRYTGERITIVCQADGKRVAYRDDWQTDGPSHDIRGINSWTGWTYLVLKGDAETPVGQSLPRALQQGSGGFGDLPKQVSEASRLRAEGKGTPPDAQILTDRQVFRGAM